MTRNEHLQAAGRLHAQAAGHPAEMHLARSEKLLAEAHELAAAALGGYTIVGVMTPGGPAGPQLVLAELREDHPTRAHIVKVVYLESRTGAWVARWRIRTEGLDGVR